ncbi:ABC transporter permease [Fulvivirgaceae bacterium BMA10]|uniref:ABC transporter permease n=1 Tax=Splendidivirga corallicola TaxID=3051826 RepID=A0ABT8KJV2_9BACT|nr:ABC transporter permease [Fulvivirgaceae bacterium BMA10]
MTKTPEHITPPKWPLKFLRFFVKKEYLEEIEGDMEEVFQESLEAHSVRKAKRIYTFEALKLFRPVLIKNLVGDYRLNNYGMFKNYFKVGVRNILKYKTFSFINVFGLAVAMSVCMLIMLMLADQKQSDQFHVKKERVYRIICTADDYVLPWASTAVPLAGTLKTDYPIIEEATQLIKGIGGDVNYKGKTMEIRGFFSDPAFFNVFSFELEKGDKNTCLTMPNAMVITSSYAKLLFKGEDPIGKIVQLEDRRLDHLGIDGEDIRPVDWGQYTITGVIADLGYKSHLKFDALVSVATMKGLHREKKTPNLTDNWWNFDHCYTYAVLKPENTSEDLNTVLDHIVATKYEDQKPEKGFEMEGQKLGNISPGPFMSIPISFRMPIEAYYILSFFAVVIMLLACLNYTNLSIARSLTRAKEIGIRKVTGGKRKDIIYQFFSESIITTLLALVMAVLLLLFVKEAFMNLWINKYINFNLEGTLSVYLVFIVFALFIGIIAGFYPALHMSGYRPIAVLKNFDMARRGKLGIRKILNISQFSVSLFFIVTSILLYNQLRHFLEFEYGFNTENIINIELQSNDYSIVSHEFSTVPGVTAISACSFIPTSGHGEGRLLKIAGSEEEYQLFTALQTDDGFIDNLGLKLVAGSNLPASENGSDHFIVINEFAVKKLGYGSAAEAIGQVLEVKRGKEVLQVIGVIEDFQFKALFEQDRNASLLLRNQPVKYQHVNLRVVSGNLMNTIEALEEKWKAIDPVHTFKYEFFDEQLDSMHSFFNDVVSIVGSITFLAIVISCLGLLGISIYTTERRTKEIGIRKVLGAGVFNVAFLVSREFLRLLAMAVLIAAPASFFANNVWLQNFPNRVSFGIGTVSLGSAILLVLGILTIITQIISVSNRNPVESLRDE